MAEEIKMFQDESENSGTSNYRAGVASLAGGSEKVDFSSSLGTTDYSLNVYDINGIGVGVTLKEADGFTVDALGAGEVEYYAIKNN